MRELSTGGLVIKCIPTLDWDIVILNMLISTL
jgi:hypothetical protein